MGPLRRTKTTSTDRSRPDSDFRSDSDGTATVFDNIPKTYSRYFKVRNMKERGLVQQKFELNMACCSAGSTKGSGKGASLKDKMLRLKANDPRQVHEIKVFLKN